MLKQVGIFNETDPIQMYVFLQCVSPFNYCMIVRDCIRFSFMDILQDELEKVQVTWNTHLMCRARQQDIIRGVPDELYYIPEIQGTNIRFAQLCSYTTIQAFKIILVNLTRENLTIVNSIQRKSHSQPHRNSSNWHVY